MFESTPLALEIVLTVAAGLLGGVLSGMFGVGGAVITTPAIRVLRATTFQAIGSTLPSTKSPVTATRSMSLKVRSRR